MDNPETGIRPSGASSILVPTSEWTKKEEFNYPGRPQLASDFLSLSPLQFNTVLQLHKKLSVLKPKGKRRGEDDSAANKPYLGNIGYSGQYRSSFEHNRYSDRFTFFSLVVIMSNCLVQIIISCFKTLLQLLEVRSQWGLSMGLGTNHFARLQRMVSRERCGSRYRLEFNHLWHAPSYIRNYRPP